MSQSILQPRNVSLLQTGSQGGYQRGDMHTNKIKYETQSVPRQELQALTSPNFMFQPFPSSDP